MATKINSDMKCAACGCDIDLIELHMNVIEYEDACIDDASVCDTCAAITEMGDDNNLGLVMEDDRQVLVFNSTIQ
jgi:hypothetical protein